MELLSYIKKIWAARFFWLHLARAELKYKFRRSRLGLLWTMVNPLLLTLMMTLILGNLLNVDMGQYAPYVFSGMIVWGFLSSAIVGGANSLLSSEPYVKQYSQPLAIYPLKTNIVNIASFLLSLSGLLLWILFTNPSNLPISLLVLPVSTLCLFILGWPLTILVSFLGVKYRDISQVLPLIMQLAWYVSPVFFRPQMFQSRNLEIFFEFNPITHILNLVRAPALNGELPTPLDFGYVLGIAFLLYIIAALRIRRSERTLIFFF